LSHPGYPAPIRQPGHGAHRNIHQHFQDHSASRTFDAPTFETLTQALSAESSFETSSPSNDNPFNWDEYIFSISQQSGDNFLEGGAAANIFGNVLSTPQGSWEARLHQSSSIVMHNPKRSNAQSQSIPNEAPPGSSRASITAGLPLPLSDLSQPAVRRNNASTYKYEENAPSNAPSIPVTHVQPRPIKTVWEDGSSLNSRPAFAFEADPKAFLSPTTPLSAIVDPREKKREIEKRARKKMQDALRILSDGINSMPPDIRERVMTQVPLRFREKGDSSLGPGRPTSPLRDKPDMHKSNMMVFGGYLLRGASERIEMLERQLRERQELESRFGQVIISQAQLAMMDQIPGPAQAPEDWDAARLGIEMDLDGSAKQYPSGGETHLLPRQNSNLCHRPEFLSKKG